VIGGVASISGAIYGALFIQFVPNFADEISKAAPWAIYGAFLLVFVYAMPTGVAGFVRMLVGVLARRWSGVTIPRAGEPNRIPREREQNH